VTRSVRDRPDGHEAEGLQTELGRRVARAGEGTLNRAWVRPTVPEGSQVMWVLRAFAAGMIVICAMAVLPFHRTLGAAQVSAGMLLLLAFLPAFTSRESRPLTVVRWLLGVVGVLVEAGAVWEFLQGRPLGGGVFVVCGLLIMQAVTIGWRSGMPRVYSLFQAGRLLALLSGLLACFLRDSF
jgi:hypothetical protein